MGFDIYGHKPINKKGDYFRNNVWWWRPLWDYVVGTCDDILTDSDMNAGGFNDGHLISAKKAEKIAERLKLLVKQGHTEKYRKQRNKELKALPLEICQHCKGTGKRNDKYVKGKCNGCNGTGEKKATATWYAFDVENVKEFAKFCKNSGGFKIY